MLDQKSKEDKNITARKLLYEVYKNLSYKRRLQLILSVLLMIISGVAEVMTISAILPFLTVLTNPELISNYYLLENFIKILGFNEVNNVVIPLTIIFSFIALLSGSIRLTNLWVLNRISALIGSDLSSLCFETILTQPYSYYSQINSSELIGTISTKIIRTVLSILSALQFLTGLIISSLILSTLMIVDYKSTTVTIIVMFFVYFILLKKSRRVLLKNSKVIAKKRNEQVKYLQEGLGGIKEILMGSYQNFYLKPYKKLDLEMRINEANNLFIASAPRFAIESIGISLISFVALFFKLRSNSVESFIPLLATFGLGIQRLLPSLQLSYISISVVRGATSEVFDVLKILKNKNNKSFETRNIKPYKFQNLIKIKNLSFKYLGAKNNVLSEINFDIKKGERIAIVGKSGQGKSTLLEIIMGLQKPTKGALTIDGIDINDPKNFSKKLKWFKSISYIPQDIYLTDGSFIENIAFGIPTKDINYDLVKSSAKISQIEQFIMTTEKKYETNIGERGVKLSGGQKQRIGIARALYKNNSILAFDEATSALDYKTEGDILNSIKSLSKEITIIFVSHRLETINFCDRIIKL